MVALTAAHSIIQQLYGIWYSYIKHKHVVMYSHASDLQSRSLNQGLPCRAASEVYDGTDTCAQLWASSMPVCQAMQLLGTLFDQMWNKDLLLCFPAR